MVQLISMPGINQQYFCLGMGYANVPRGQDDQQSSRTLVLTILRSSFQNHQRSNRQPMSCGLCGPIQSWDWMEIDGSVLYRNFRSIQVCPFLIWTHWNRFFKALFAKVISEGFLLKERPSTVKPEWWIWSF